MKIFNTSYFNSKEKQVQKQTRVEILSSPLYTGLLLEVLERRMDQVEGQLDGIESQFKLAKALGARRELKHIMSLFKESDNG